ncbi:Zn-ribbon domain-containing OB-fold protein [Schauerella aestuarii]|uniref:Zn-ribbon domain-containing OB-fold protein n=1 Tax=Schauerella aestuarii TaxID=2511204 RepID=UPI00136DE227|nr:OB-fold domain-containing protein [Achromobacter aestuarii]MYZ45313.1 short-chain dehydrogenase [Achromobacter aestuarii]
MSTDLDTQALPPAARSAKAQELNAIAAQARFALQGCTHCGTIQYPPREVCVNCLSDALKWRDVSSEGKLLAVTTLHHSNEPYFQARLPWRVGMVRFDCGPSAVVHVDADCIPDGRVRITLDLDASGQAVLTAHAIAPPGAVNAPLPSPLPGAST